MNITTIIVGVILILFGVISTFAIPYIKTHMTAEQITILTGIAQTVVYAAEKIFGAKMGKDKLAYALEQAKKLLESKGLTFDESTVRAAIEAQVEQLGFDKAASEATPITVKAEAITE